eukprot:3875028-Pyramimonas_sp.AAC.2
MDAKEASIESSRKVTTRFARQFAVGRLARPDPNRYLAAVSWDALLKAAICARCLSNNLRYLPRLFSRPREFAPQNVFR